MIRRLMDYQIRKMYMGLDKPDVSISDVWLFYICAMCSCFLNESGIFAPERPYGKQEEQDRVNADNG